MTYPLSYGSTGANAYCATFRSSSVSNRSISTSPFMRSVTHLKNILKRSFDIFKDEDEEEGMGVMDLINGLVEIL